MKHLYKLSEKRAKLSISTKSKYELYYSVDNKKLDLASRKSSERFCNCFIYICSNFDCFLLQVVIRLVYNLIIELYDTNVRWNIRTVRCIAYRKNNNRYNSVGATIAIIKFFWTSLKRQRWARTWIYENIIIATFKREYWKKYIYSLSISIIYICNGNYVY